MRFDSLETPEAVELLSKQIIESKAFVRLKDVSFLGAIERFGDAQNRSAGSRFDHSIGVAKLIWSMSDSLGLTAGELRLAVAHALLHDVGHGPFSHSSEYFFSKIFKIDHHSALIELINERTSEVSRILNSHNLWFDYRRFLRSPTSFPAVHSLFYGPINVDTIEGILRSADFFGIDSKIDSAAIINALSGRISVRPLDRFWDLKSTVYNEFIYNNECSVYDDLLNNALFLIKDKIQQSDFFLTDSQFEEKYSISIDRKKKRNKRWSAAPRQREFRIDKRQTPRNLPKLSARYSDTRGTNARSRSDNRKT